VSIEKDLILDYLGNRERNGEGRLMQEAAYYLMRLIFRARDFDSLQQLAEFCQDPDNLRPWLRNETDRLVLSEELCEDLREMNDIRHLRERAAKRVAPRRSRHPRGQAERSSGLHGESRLLESGSAAPELRVHCASDCGA
jgi:hypothetical protein